MLYICKRDDGTVYGVANTKKLLEGLPNKVRDTRGLIVDAVRKVIFNALIHQDFSACIPVQISVYENKLYISNDCVFHNEPLKILNSSNWHSIKVSKSIDYFVKVHTWASRKIFVRVLQCKMLVVRIRSFAKCVCVPCSEIFSDKSTCECCKFPFNCHYGKCLFLIRTL